MNYLFIHSIFNLKIRQLIRATFNLNIIRTSVSLKKQIIMMINLNLTLFKWKLNSFERRQKSEKEFKNFFISCSRWLSFSRFIFADILDLRILSAHSGNFQTSLLDGSGELWLNPILSTAKFKNRQKSLNSPSLLCWRCKSW